MSDAVRNLRLVLTLDDQASAALKQQQAAQIKGIKQVADEQARADAAYVRAIRAHLAAEKQLEREKLRAIKAASKAQADAAKEESARVKQLAKETAKAAADAAKEQVRSAKDAAKEQERLNRDLNAMLRQSERETGREREQLNRQMNALIKDSDREAVRSAKEVAREKVRSEKQTFRAWKEEMDQKHRLAMQSWRDEQQATKEQEKNVGDLVQSFIGLNVVKDVAGWIQQAMKASGDSIKEAREQVKGMVGEMESARTGLKELAALRGKDATAGFSATIAREAASAGLDVADYKEFSTAWEAYAGQYVGKEGATPEDLAKEGKKIAADQALALQKQIGGYAVGARGLKADDSAQLLGLIMSKSKAGASNDEILSNYAKMMKVAELAPGRTSPLLGQITELGMENVGPDGDMKSVLDAATLVRVMSQRNPNEASTYGRALFRGLRDIRKSPEKMRELGIDRKMGFREQLEAIDKAVRKHTAAGGDQGEFLGKYFKDIREWGGIQTAINEGLRGGAFKRAEQEAAGVNADTVRGDITRYRRSQEGRAATDRSEEIAVSRERAGKYAELRHMQSEVRKAHVSSGDLEIPEGMVDAFMTQGPGQVFGGGSRQEQEERAEVGRVIRQRLLQSHEGRRWLIGHNPDAARAESRMPSRNMTIERQRADFASQGMFNRDTQESFLADAANYLKRLVEIEEKKQNQRNRQDAPPLVRPPSPRGR